MISFEFHLEKWHEKTQEPQRFLGFWHRYLFRCYLLARSTEKDITGFSGKSACEKAFSDFFIFFWPSTIVVGGLSCLGIVRDLAERNPPVGVFFESEAIFSLNDDSQLALSFQATMAEEESHTRSRSMESSLRMRLDNGIPLTPKLLGYTHDADGCLVSNPNEAPTVKLAFFMYLYGYSTQQIADA